MILERRGTGWYLCIHQAPTKYRRNVYRNSFVLYIHSFDEHLLNTSNVQGHTCLFIKVCEEMKQTVV